MVTAHSLRTLFGGFLLAREADGPSPHTLEAYRLMFNNIVRDSPPEKLQNVMDLTPQDFQEWVIDLRKRLATATIDQRISKGKAFFNWCVREGFLESNPMGAIKRPKKNWQPDPLSEDEVTMLLDSTRHSWASVRDRAIVCMLLDSGMRNSELYHLMVEDITLKTGEVKIRQRKGGKDRMVLIGKRAKEALWQWMIQRPEEADYLFCTVQGKPINRTRLAVIVRRLGERINIRAYPHRLRHTFALMFLKNGGDPYTLQYLLGHEDMSTVREYVKIAAQDAKEMYRSPLDALE